MSVEFISPSTAIADRGSGPKHREKSESLLGRLASGIKVTQSTEAIDGVDVADVLPGIGRALLASRRSAADGISMSQTAESAIVQARSRLVEMHEAALKASTADLDGQQRTVLDLNFNVLRLEVDEIASHTTFNGVNILGDDSMELELWDERGEMSLVEVRFQDASSEALVSGIGAATLKTVEGASQATSMTEEAVARMDELQVVFESLRERLHLSLDRLKTVEENIGAAESRISDTDRAAETSSNTRGQILLRAGISMQAQASGLPGLAMTLVGS